MLTQGLEIMLVHSKISKEPEGFSDMVKKTYGSSVYRGKKYTQKLWGKQNLYKKSWIKCEKNENMA